MWGMKPSCLAVYLSCLMSSCLAGYLSWYHALSSHWPDMAAISCSLAESWHAPLAHQASFGFAMGILARLCLSKIRLNRVRSNSLDMPMKNTMKVRLPIRQGLHWRRFFRIHQFWSIRIRRRLHWKDIRIPDHLHTNTTPRQLRKHSWWNG